MQEIHEPQKGAITEVVGGRSSGKTRLLMSYIERATKGMEFAAVIDSTDSFDPVSAESAGIDLDRVLWIRCSEDLNTALKSADYVLHGGGFGLVILDIGDVRPEIVARIPNSYWFRFRLAVEKTQTAFLLISPLPCCGSSCSVSLQCTAEKIEWIGSPDHRLIKGFCFKSAMRKKPGMIPAGAEKSADRISKKIILPRQ